jgi:hypothetical protein
MRSQTIVDATSAEGFDDMPAQQTDNDLLIGSAPSMPSW